MVEPLRITNTAAERKQAVIDEMVDRVNRCIKRAIENGCNETCFSYDRYDTYYSEVRAIFERAGYTIKPTGYNGGVWQTTEKIIW